MAEKKPADELVTVLGFQFKKEGLDKFKKGMETARDYTLKLVAGVSALAAGAGYLTHGVAEATAEADNFGKQIGMSAAQLQEWEYVAKKQGITTDELRDGFKELSKQLGEARLGTGSMVGAFQEHNKVLLDQLVLSKDTEEAFGSMLEALFKIKDPSERTRVAIAAFGEEAGTKMVRMLSGGIESITKLRDRAKELGVGMSEENVKASQAFMSGWIDIQTLLTSVKNTLGSALMPALTKFLEKVAEWTIKNRDVVKTKIITFITTVGEKLKLLWAVLTPVVATLKVMFGALSIIGNILNWIIGLVGGWTSALEILISAFAGFKAMQLFVFFKGIVMALKAQAIASKASAVAFYIQATAAKVAGVAMRFATMGIPALIAAVVAAITWMIFNWDKVKTAVSAYFKYLADGFNNIVNIIKNKPLFKALAVGADAFMLLWKNVFTYIKNGLSFIADSALFKGVMAVAGKVSGFFKGKEKNMGVNAADVLRPAAIRGVSEFGGRASTTTNTMTNSNNKKQVSQDIKFNINGAGDPKAIAEAVGNKIREMSDDTSFNVASVGF